MNFEFNSNDQAIAHRVQAFIAAEVLPRNREWHAAVVQQEGVAKIGRAHV